MIKRLFLGILLMLNCSFSVSAGDYADLKSELQNVIANCKAKIGIAVIVDGKDTICINNDERYPMMSVYKFHQAVAVAYVLERRGISLDSTIYVSKNELRPNTYSPFREKYPEGHDLFSISELLTYTLQLSDNNACDILFDHILNVADTDAVLHQFGGTNFKISATERAMQKDISKCYENWSTPLASAKLIDDLVAGRILKGRYHDFVVSTMLACTTGAQRLPRPLPVPGPRIGHKTGTSGKDSKGNFIAVTDIGFIFLEGGKRYSVAVFVKDSSENLQTNEQIIADISNELYSFLEN